MLLIVLPFNPTKLTGSASSTRTTSVPEDAGVSLDIAIPVGVFPNGTVAITILFALLLTETVLGRSFVAYS